MAIQFRVAEAGEGGVDFALVLVEELVLFDGDAGCAVGDPRAAEGRERLVVVERAAVDRYGSGAVGGGVVVVTALVVVVGRGFTTGDWRWGVGMADKACVAGFDEVIVGCVVAF